ncbi:MAG TPA: hypothetical protein VKB71_15325 [Rhizomicrobium sp.]|nr:hypothetical protein [Rhizomicrobium sp.]
MRLFFCAIFCLGLSGSASAADTGLKPVSDALKAVRGTHNSRSQYDAGPELTPVKHALRRWIEGQLPKLGQHGKVDRFSKTLTDAIEAANLTCDAVPADEKRCTENARDNPGQTNNRGYLAAIDASYLEDGRYLVVQTNVGIRCGFDESAYVYEWRGNSWKPLLQSEQNDYRDKHYSPQNFLSIQASFANVAWNKPAPRPPLILTLGYSPWCQSNWQTLYTRLWRASAQTQTPAPLVDTKDSMFLGDNPARARMSDDDVLIEFDGDSVDGGKLVRPHLRHYAVRYNKVARIAPIALKPDDFVEEWLTRPWTESATWSDQPSDDPALQKWYGSFHAGAEIIFGEFDGAPLHCRRDKTLWQVGFTQQAGPKNPEVTAHFLVRWMAPYRFTIVKVQKEKFPGCDVKDAVPDNLGTLVPLPSGK